MIASVWLNLLMLIYMNLCLQGLTIIAFNKGNIDAKTIREVLSLGPTFVVMKFLESKSL